MQAKYMCSILFYRQITSHTLASGCKTGLGGTKKGCPCQGQPPYRKQDMVLIKSRSSGTANLHLTDSESGRSE